MKQKNMDLRNKTFKNNRTGELVTVIDAFENIAILENKEKIDVRRLTNNEFFTEQIDPKNFFSNQSAYNILADKIKNIPQSQIRDDDGPVQRVDVTPGYNNSDFGPIDNESAIIVSTEDDERAELARKYGASIDNSSVARQNEAFAKLLGEDSEDLPIIQNPPVYSNISVEEPVQRIEINREEPNDIKINQKIQQEVEDPIITMFRKTKRNVDFNISVDIYDKIPRLDFIEMMEDSYEISMIDFLSEEFTNKIIQNPSIIKDKIKNRITELVYGKTETPVNPQITDSVTQTSEVKVEKTKTVRKPRVKKESTEK